MVGQILTTRSIFDQLRYGRPTDLLVKALTVLGRRPVLLIIAASVAYCVAAPAGSALDGKLGPGAVQPGGDLSYFAAHGTLILHGHLHDVFASPLLQSGPIQLVIAAALLRIVHWPAPGSAQVAQVILTAAANTALVLLVRTVLWRMSARRIPAVEAAVVLMCTIWSIAGQTFDAGHVAELSIPLLWVTAGYASQSGRWFIAGLSIAVAVGMETWGLLGVIVLLLAPTFGCFIRSAAVSSLLDLSMFLPFIVGSRFGMFGMAWSVSEETLVHLVVPGMQEFSWWMRLVQAVFAVACGLLTLRVHGQTMWDSPVLVSLAVLSGRLLLDPAGSDYYYQPMRALLVILVFAAVTTTYGRSLMALGVALVACLDTSVLPGTWVGALVTLVCVAAAASATRGRHPGYETNRGSNALTNG